MTLAFDDDHAALYTVGQVAGMLDVQPSRSDGGQRRYTRNEIALVQHVSQMADAGMTLAGIRRILTLEAEVARLQHQIARLRAAAAGLQQPEQRQQQQR